MPPVVRPLRSDVCWISAFLVLVGGLGCARRPVACDGAGPCGGVVSTTSRRFVLPVTEEAYLERGTAAPPGTLPAWVTLGKQGNGPRAVLLRFAVPADLEVEQAFLLFARADDVDSDGAGVGLHAERVIGPWRPESATWVSGPELRDARDPTLLLRRGGPRRIRVDVTRMMKRPNAAEPPDQGVALVADRATSQGVAITLVPDVASPLPGDPESVLNAIHLPPRLELYVK